MPLTVYRHSYSDLQTVHAEGFWDVTDSGKDKQPGTVSGFVAFFGPWVSAPV
jgi:hypothetical protein